VGVGSGCSWIVILVMIFSVFLELIMSVVRLYLVMFFIVCCLVCVIDLFVSMIFRFSMVLWVMLYFM